VFWKIAAIVLCGVASEVITLLDYKWHDKRTRLFKRLRVALLVAIPLSVAATVAVAMLDEKETREMQADLHSKLDALRQQASSESAQADQRATGLTSQVAELKTMLSPFVELAEARHPGAAQADALKMLRSDLGQVAARTSALEIKTSDRSVTPAIRARMLSTLSGAAVAKCHVGFGAPPEAEPRRFAAALLQVFEDAGWKGLGVSPDLISSPDFVDTQATFKSRPDSGCGLALLKALRIADLDPKIVLDPSGADDCYVFVGGRKR
jgi:hypothetical protein